MKLTIAACGKLKPSAELQLVEKYQQQLPWAVTFKEIDLKKPTDPDGRKRAEAEELLAATAACHKRIVLDERGQSLSSTKFAYQLQDWMQAGDSHIGICIGGQDGLDASVREKSDLLLCFGQMTWPHMLARAMLMEQLYRAHTILTRHPYHRD